LKQCREQIGDGIVDLSFLPPSRRFSRRDRDNILDRLDYWLSKRGYGWRTQCAASGSMMIRSTDRRSESAIAAGHDLRGP
jgi:hypothetical protein